MPSSGLGAYQVKIHQIVFGGLFFLAVMMGVRAMMAGGTDNVKLLAAISIVIGIVLFLDQYYWLLCPALFVSGIQLPGLPFSGPELGCIVLIGLYFIRQAVHKERQIKLNRKLLVAFPVFVWICVVWMLNPTGMAIFGSSSIGARFYLQIVLGFVAMIVLSSFHFSEKDCRLLFYVLLVASIFTMAQTILNPLPAATLEEIDLENRQSRYEFLGALTFYILMFSRYRLSDILSSLWKLSLVLLFAVATIYSGKRRGFGTLLIIPVLRSFLTGKDKLPVMVFSFLGAILVALAVAGDGALWRLPNSAQRGLSVVVPKYQTSRAIGVTDLFREEVRGYGREVIRDNPWFGRKGFAMDRGETSWMLYGGTGQNRYAGHTYSGNWHNTWYAFACDFGLPAMVLWGVFQLVILIWTYCGCDLPGFGTYSSAIYLYYAFVIFTEAVFSYTSGHSAMTAYKVWITWGMILAIQNGVRDREPQIGQARIS